MVDIETKSNRYDGIHLLGPSGCRDLTRNIVNILKAGLREKTSGNWSIPSTQRYANLVQLTSSPQIAIANRFDVFNQGN